MLKYRLLRQSGAETLEFLAVVSLLAIVVIPAFYMFGSSVQKAVCNLVDSISGTTSDCAAGIIFSQDSGKWSNLMGSLNGEGRKCSGDNTNNLTLANGTNGQDYTISTNAQLNSGSGYGVIFRASGPAVNNALPTSGYSFQYDKGLNKFVFRKFCAICNPKESIISQTSEKPVGYDWNKSQPIKVVVNGNTFTAYVDGKEVLKATDNTYPSGQVGLRTWGGNNCFDDFKVTTP